MNAYAMSIEPHTNYLGRSASADFDISMRLSLVGIGAVLQERDEYITIRELVPGGPAARSGKLAVGDRIVGVGQGDDAVADVVGSRVDEVVKLIRGGRTPAWCSTSLPADAGPMPSTSRSPSPVTRSSSKSRPPRSRSSRPAKAPPPARSASSTCPRSTKIRRPPQRRQGYRSASRDVARLIDERRRRRSTAS